MSKSRSLSILNQKKKKNLIYPVNPVGPSKVETKLDFRVMNLGPVTYARGHNSRFYQYSTDICKKDFKQSVGQSSGKSFD